MARLVLLLAALFMSYVCSQWTSKQAALWAIEEFGKLEAKRRPHARGTDRRSSSPFITGDSIRHHCPHHCDSYNHCKMSPETFKDGECVFVESDLFEHFAKVVMSKIPFKFVVVVHNGDLSSPDGQDDARATKMKPYVASDIMDMAYKSGKLIAMHTTNLWWGNYSTGAPKPPYAHCLPMGYVRVRACSKLN